MKRTYQASKVRRARTHGFLVRMKIARRPRRDQRPPRQGPQAPGGLSAAAERWHARAAAPRPPAARASSIGRLRARPRRCAAAPRRAHFAVHHARGSADVPARRRAAVERRSYQQSDAPPVRCLWMTRPPSPPCSRPRAWVGAVVPKRHARSAVTRTLHQAPDLRRGRTPSRPSCAPGLWIVRLRAPFDRAQFVSAASRRAARRRARASSTTLLARRRRRGAPIIDELLAAARADRAGPRLPAAAEPLARQRLPLRADLLGLRARRARARTAPPPAAALTLGRIVRCHPGAPAATTRCRRRRRGSSPPLLGRADARPRSRVFRR